MATVEQNCGFCDFNSQEMTQRVVYFGTSILTIVSRPWFRENHLLVLPKEHRTAMGDLSEDERTELIEEVAMISSIVGTEFGYMTLQKQRPLQKENGITMSHLHMHVYPIIESDTALVPVPDTQSFVLPTDAEVAQTVAYVQRERAHKLSVREH